MQIDKKFITKSQFFALVILFIITASMMVNNAGDKNYFVAEKGNDAYNGLTQATPWKTIEKINSTFSTINPGDEILFNRGDTFYGTLIISKTGEKGNPIVIGAYGTGDKPIITGFTTIAGWTDEGSGIYSKIITSEAQTRMVTIDDVQYGMGRWPNKNYNSFKSHVKNVSITDPELGNIFNWTGAEVVIRKNDWTLDRCLITKHVVDTLVYTNLGSKQAPNDNFGYFIQNDLRCLTDYGEWYHNTTNGKFYMYFGGDSPANKIVKVANLNFLISNSGFDYITIDNISCQGSIGCAIYFKGDSVDNMTIQNCNTNFSGSNGIYLESNSKNTIVNNNQINHSSEAGILVNGGNLTITNNTIRNTGLIGGIANSGTMNDGIYLRGLTRGIIQYNSIDSSGYNGIFMSGNNIEIRNNLIENSVLLLDDGGGIYTNSSRFTGRIIDGNIILNVFGNNEGTPDTVFMAEGIYLDESAANLIVQNNTVANCSNSGIKLHKAHGNTILNNTSFNNKAGIKFENWTTKNTIYNNIIQGNIFFSKSNYQFPAFLRTAVDDIPSFGTFNNNYYIRPTVDNCMFFTGQPSTGIKKRTLKDWQLFSKQDANSKMLSISNQAIKGLRFEYNPTKEEVTIPLGSKYVGLDDKIYSSSVTLKPFSSKILIQQQ